MKRWSFLVSTKVVDRKGCRSSVKRRRRLVEKSLFQLELGCFWECFTLKGRILVIFE